MRNIQHSSIHDIDSTPLVNSNIEELTKRLSKVFSRNNLAVSNRALSADTTLSFEDSSVSVDTSGGNITITLTYANSWGTYKTPLLLISRISATNKLTIAATAGDSIKYWSDGNTITTGSIEVKGIVVLLSDGANTWWALNGVGNSPVSGVYTPTLTNVNNLDASTACVCQYMVVGNVCTVSGSFLQNATTAATLTRLRISLPLTSALASTTQVGGTAANVAGGSYQDIGMIYADTTNDAAYVDTHPTANTNVTWYFSFTYLIV